MANSRTKILIPMLVLCFFAVTAYGQAVLSLGSNPTRVRVEGITEVVGLITLSNNTNSPQFVNGPGPGTGVSISIVFDGTITNNPSISTAPVTASRNGNIYTTGTNTVSGNSSQVGGVGAPVTITQSGNTIVLSIPNNFSNTGTAGTVNSCAPAAVGANALCLIPGGSLNIEGVRVNVSGLPAGPINATVTTTPANALTIPGGNNSTVVGRSQATIGAVTVIGATIGQCTVKAAPNTTNQATFFTAAGLINLAGGAAAFTTGDRANIEVDEPSSYPLAFTSTNDEDVFTPSPTSPVVLGGTAVSTTPGFQGFADPPTNTTAIPVKNGVTLVFNFTGIPAGVSLVVPSSFTNTTATSTMVLNNTGVTTPTALVGVVTGTTSGAATVNYVIASTTGSGTIVDKIFFDVAFTAPAGTVVPTGSVGALNVSVGPTSTSLVLSSAVTVRFVTNQTGVNASTLGSVNPCLTNLLFPFVSNRTGTTFNAGLAISNTASDATFGAKTATTGQTGGVTLWFFGVSAPTGGTAGIALPIPAVSTGGTVATAGVIAPGEHTAFVLNDGSTKAIAPGFQGYVIALCGFQYAHGLATIFDNFGIGPANVGFSYEPLVLNGTPPTRVATGNNGISGTLRPGAVAVGPETLGH